MDHKTQMALMERGLKAGLAGFGVDVKVKKLKLNMAGGKAVASGVFTVPGKSDRLEVEARYKLPVTADIACAACEACGRQLAQKVRAWTFGRRDPASVESDAEDGQLLLLRTKRVEIERPDEEER